MASASASEAIEGAAASVAADPSASAAADDVAADEKQHMIPTDLNVLKKHVAFFDRNHDGIVYPWETFQGFRAIGCGVGLSLGAAIFINVGLSQKTRRGKCISLLFPIEVENIQFAKHTSDSGVYDSEGRFVPETFEEMFVRNAQTNANYLTGDELKLLLRSNREPKDYLGWLAAYSEWQILYKLCQDKNGLLHKVTVRSVYDGSLFDLMEKEHLAKKKA